MSRNWSGFTIPGCGRQSRDVGAHGKIESKLATGSCAASVSEAVGLAFHLIFSSQMFRASEVAPYPAPSSCVPTIGMAASSFGCRVPSMSAGSKPSPIRLSGTRSESMKKCTMRAFGLPAIILFFSSA